MEHFELHLYVKITWQSIMYLPLLQAWNSLFAHRPERSREGMDRGRGWSISHEILGRPNNINPIVSICHYTMTRDRCKPIGLFHLTKPWSARLSSLPEQFFIASFPLVV
jgi:hypothetical protein